MNTLTFSNKTPLLAIIIAETNFVSTKIKNSWRKILQILTGLILCLIGIIVLLHGSDLNPFWYMNGYTIWFGNFTIIKWFTNPVLWIILCVPSGSLIISYGAMILEKEIRKNNR